jgi:hypothetical protein
MFTLVPILLALATLTSAQDYSITSAPFNLVILSDGPKLNNDTLSACHTGRSNGIAMPLAFQYRWHAVVTRCLASQYHC